MVITSQSMTCHRRHGLWSLRRVVVLTVSTLLCSGLVSTCEATTLEDAVAAHSATQAKIKTLYLSLKISFGPSADALQQMSTTQTWREGARERTLQRVLKTMTTQGLKDVSPVDQTSQFSYDDMQTRTLRGWDPANPLQLPLDETRNETEFGRVKGGIGPRDPQGGTADDWATLLLEVSRGQSLSDLVRKSEVELIEAPRPEIVRLKVLATEHPQLVGVVIDLDSEHGYLISRLETPKTGTIATVDGFTAFGEGIWLPDRVRRTLKNAVAVAERVEARVNEPMSDADLTVQFPEGARVDEVLTKRIFLWGSDEPAETFESFAQFHEHQLRQMKLAKPVSPVVTSNGPNWLLWVNVIGIAVLLGLMTFRKQLVKS